MADELMQERGRLMSLLVRRAEDCSAPVWCCGRIVHRGEVAWPKLSAAIEAYPVEHADMLRARSVKGAASLEVLDIALQCDLGRAKGKASAKTAKRWLRDVLVIVAAMHRLGEGLRFGELLAATGLGETRLAKVLAFGARTGVLQSAGEYGWFLGGSGLARVYEDRAKAQEGRRR